MNLWNGVWVAIPGRVQLFVTLLVQLSMIYLLVSAFVGIWVRGLTAGRLQALFAGHRAASMTVAGFLGAVTPFCSCSTVPMTAGMLRAGVTLPVLATFLVASPLVSPTTAPS
jgi:hypothetical protein